MILVALKPKLLSTKNTFFGSRKQKNISLFILFILIITFLTLFSSGYKSAQIISLLKDQIKFSLTVGILLLTTVTSLIRGISLLFLSADTSLMLSSPVSRGELFKIFFIQILASTQWTVWFFLSPLGLGFVAGGGSLIFIIEAVLLLLSSQVVGTSLSIILALITTSLFPVVRLREIVILIFLIFLITSSLAAIMMKLTPDSLTVSLELMPAYHIDHWAIIFSTILVLFISRSVFINNFHKVYSSLSDHRRGTALTYVPINIPLVGKTRAIVGKELRLFLRNPSQVVQSLAFLVGMLLYLSQSVMIGRYSGEPVVELSKAFLHAFLSSVFIAFVAGRLVFPSFSLEGQSIWMIISSPITSNKLIWSKWSIWSAILLCIGGIFHISSSLALNINPDLILWSLWLFIVLVCVQVMVSLCFGAVFVRFDWEHPGAVTGGLGSFFTSLFCSIVTIGIVIISVSIPLIGAVNFPNKQLVIIALYLAITLVCYWIVQKAAQVGSAAISQFGEAKAGRKRFLLRKRSK